MDPLLVFFDLETTGLNLEEDEIVQIAALANTDESEEFSVFVLPSVEISEGASNVNGMTIQYGQLVRNGRVLRSTDIRSALKVVFKLFNFNLLWAIISLVTDTSATLFVLCCKN